MGVLRVAVASSDGKFINQHFGKATRFYIYDVEPESAKFVEVRDNPVPVCDSNCQDVHRDEAINDAVAVIADCSLVLVSQIGFGAREQLKVRGLIPFEVPDSIDRALQKLAKSKLIERSGGPDAGR